MQPRRTITFADCAHAAVIVIAVFVVLAYWNGWG